MTGGIGLPFHAEDLHTEDLRAGDLHAEDLRAGDLHAEDLRAGDLHAEDLQVQARPRAGWTVDDGAPR